MAEPTDVQDPAKEADAGPQDDADQLSEYSTETGDAAVGPARPAARKPVVTGSALGTGRRKEAIARVRIAAGTGEWLITTGPWTSTSRTRCTSS